MQEKLTAKLAKVVVGDPQKEETTMGALASIKQKHDVAERVAELNKDAKIVFGGNDSFTFNADHPEKALFSLQLYWCANSLYKRRMFIPRFRPGMYTHAISKH